jgi:hypothetical protein
MSGFRFEAYAIVSADGMLADVQRHMPNSSISPRISGFSPRPSIARLLSCMALTRMKAPGSAAAPMVGGPFCLITIKVHVLRAGQT